MKPTVLSCTCCGRVKQYHEWVEKPAKLYSAIADNKVNLKDSTCPACTDDLK